MQDKDIILIVDESQKDNKKYLNTMIADVEQPERIFLLSCVVIDKSPNTELIVGAVHDNLLGIGIQRSRLALFITDAAPYMSSAGEIMKSIYPHMHHIKCVAHLFHNIAEKVRSRYEYVDNLIATIKQSIVKNSSRKALFDHLPAIPEPVCTRWGSWIDAALYYSKYLDEIKEIFEEIDGDCKILQNAKNAVASREVHKELVLINRNYSFIPGFITKMESRAYIINNLSQDLQNINFGEDPVGVKKYMEKRLNKNDVTKIMNLECDRISPYLNNLLLECNPTSCEVERSFSILNHIIRKDRHFLDDNLNKYIFLKMSRKL